MKYKLKSLSLSKEVIIGIGIVILSLGILLFNLRRESVQSKALEQEEIQMILTTLDNLEDELLDFYTDENQDYIDSEMSLNDLKNIEPKITDLTDAFQGYKQDEIYHTFENKRNAIDTLMLDLAAKVEMEETINQLFEEKVIIGEETNLSIPIIESLTFDHISTIERYNPISESKNWKESINALIDNATEQVAQIERATEQVNAFYSEDEIIDNPTQEMYDTALLNLQKINNETVISSLKEKLTPVLTKIETNSELAKVEQQAQTEATEVEETGVEISTSNVVNNQSKTETVQAKPKTESPKQEVVQSKPSSNNNTNTKPANKPIKQETPKQPEKAKPVEKPVENSKTNHPSFFYEIGSSGKVFDTSLQASIWAENEMDKNWEDPNWFTSFTVRSYFKNDSSPEKWTVDFENY